MLAQAETATVITPSVTQETSDLASIRMVASVPERRRRVNSLAVTAGWRWCWRAGGKGDGLLTIQ
jgi:hypothetical protein